MNATDPSAKRLSVIRDAIERGDPSLAKAALQQIDILLGTTTDKNDRKYLETLIDLFAGGPTGVEALAATMNLAGDTLSDEIEPYLLREQYIIRSPRGRVATPKAFALLGRKPSLDDKQPGLFE